MAMLQPWRHQRPFYFVAGFGLAAIVAAFIWAGFTEPIDSYAACIKAGYPVLESNPPVCRAGNRNFMGTPTPSPAPAAVVDSVPFEILVNGDTASSIPAHEQQFIPDQAAWTLYWRRVHSGLATTPPILAVNFATSDVIGLSLGEKTTGGYNLKVTSITVKPSGSVVDLTETTPTITCNVTQSFSNRYLIVRTLSKLTEPVSFRITSDYRHCP